MTDANGLRFWSWTEASDWSAVATAVDQPPPAYDDTRRTFTLGRYARVEFTETPADAPARWALSRTATDAHGTFAYFDALSGDVHGAGSAPGSLAIHTPTVPPSDLAVSSEGTLYLIEGAEIGVLDLLDRWDFVRVSHPDISPTRITAAGDRVWVLDRTQRRLAQVRGRPLPRRGLRVRAPDVFDPHEENPDPPRVVPMPVAFDPAEDPIDIAAADDGRIAVLLWRGADEALVRFVSPEGAISAAHVLGEIERPYALGWLDDDTLAVMVAALHQPVEGGPEVPGGTQIVTYLAGLSDTDVTRPPLGGVFPTPGHDLAPFVRGVSTPLRYAIAITAAGDHLPPRKLVRVSANFRAPGGELELPAGVPIDSGQVGFVWHRAYLEADLPVGCGVRLFVGTSDDHAVLPEEEFEHVFGELAATRGLPRGVWSTVPSELPFHPGLMPCPIVPHRCGLFSVLLQRATRRVSALAGRYLWVRLALEGNGQNTPELAALRVYGSRFSYVTQYLPRVFHEELLPPEADDALEDGPRSESDFLERFLCNFEGVLTPLEDRIANAHLLTDPATVPDESLDWLGSWVGFVFDAAYPDAHRREALRQAMNLHRWRGTLRGLRMAIDILTGGRLVDGEMIGGAVTRGQVVLLEGWRMRRTFATLLGIDLSHENDPLLAGIARSGNSRVGDSLILAPEHRTEFLALMRRVLPGAEPPEGVGTGDWFAWVTEHLVDRFVVEPFFDELAHRLVVLVHDDLGTDLVALIRRVAELEAPIHLETEVSPATYPFIVGLASLVGIDTYLRAPEAKPKILLDESRLGAPGFLSRPAALDPRLEGGLS